MPAYAVDVGYGFTKAISDRGNKICLPSVVAPARADLLDGLFATAGAHNYRVWLKQNDQEADNAGKRQPLAHKA
nr:hypothetical protein [Desulfurispora thermophila]